MLCTVHAPVQKLNVQGCTHTGGEKRCIFRLFAILVIKKKKVDENEEVAI